MNILMHESMWRSEDNLRFLFSFLRQDVSADPEFPALVRLAGQRSPRILLLSPLQHWLYKHRPPLLDGEI